MALLITLGLVVQLTSLYSLRDTLAFIRVSILACVIRPTADFPMKDL
jgi:hypothetical protein